MSTHMTTVFQSQRALMVKNLRPGLTECGKIKIGVKGNLIKSKQGNEFQPPQKLDHFVITTLQRGDDGNFLRDRDLHQQFGERPTEIPVRLLFDDPWLNFQTVYTAFKGATRFCTGDGETAQRLQQDGSLREMACPCHLLDPAYQGKDKCKINGTLSVMIEGATVVGGVWKLRTTSINTCQGIASSLAFILSVTGGKLAGIPLMLTVRPKAATTPTGVSTTVYVVGIEFRGSIEMLRDYAHKQALADATHGERMKHVEDYARKLLAAPIVNEEEDEDIRDEFYPGAAADAHDALLVQTEGPTAAERRAAMMRGDNEPALVEVADEYGEVHMMLPGEVEQFKRDNAGAKVIKPEPKIEEPAQSDPELPAQAKTNSLITVWLGPKAQIKAPAGEALASLAQAIDDVKLYGELNALLENNEKLLTRLKNGNKDKMDTRIANARQRVADPTADPMADLDDLDHLPGDDEGGEDARQERLV